MTKLDKDWKELQDQGRQGSRVFMGLAARWWIFILTMALVASGVFLGVEPIRQRIKRAIFVETHQYQESLQDAVSLHEQEAARVRVEIEKAKAAGNMELRAALEDQLALIEQRIEAKEKKTR